MRATCAAIATACLACACGSDPKLAIVVHHPTDSVIASTTVTVYVSASLTCNDVQFGDVDDATLAGLQVAQETLRTGMAPEGSLDGLPRVDHKVIAARGIGADGKLATGGCVEADEITRDVSLEIDTQAAVLASFAGGGDAYGVAVTVAGLDGKVVAGRAVSWRVIGPDGTMPAVAAKAAVLANADATWDRPSATCTSSDGDVTLHPVPPDLTGGYAARIRVAWAQEPPPPFTALTKLTPGERPLSPVATVAHPCAIGHNASASAKHVVACVNAGTPATVDVFSASSSGGTVSYATVGSTSLTVAGGLYAIPNANGSDVDIIGVDSSGLGKLVSIYGTSVVKPCPDCGAFVDAMYVPACDAVPALLLGRTAQSVIRQLPPLGGAASTFPAPPAGAQDIAFVGAGCVTRFYTTTNTSSQAQVVVLDYVTKITGRVTNTRAVVCTSAGCAAVDLKVPGSGVGFTTGAAPSIVVSSVDATGVILSAVDVVTTGAQNELLELSRISSAAVPHRIASGQFDSDGQLDFAWDNVTGARAAPVLQVAYARPGFDANLSALTGLSTADDSASVLDVQAGAITDDASDDVLVVTSSSAIVLPTLVPAATGSIPDDPAPSPACP